MAYSRAGRAADAERVLDQALRAAPQNAAANFNRGLLLAEAGRKKEAEDSLRKALAADPQLAPAAFNLCVLDDGTPRHRRADSCRQAAKAEPRNEKYAFSLGFYLNQTGQSGEAMQFLEAIPRQVRRRFGLATPARRSLPERRQERRGARPLPRRRGHPQLATQPAPVHRKPPAGASGALISFRQLRLEPTGGKPERGAADVRLPHGGRPRPICSWTLASAYRATFSLRAMARRISRSCAL